MRASRRPYGVPKTCESGGGSSVSGGFTLLELLMAVAILTVLVSLAAPSFQSIRESSQRRSAIAGLADVLALARAEAVTRGVPVDLCPVATLDSATLSCAADNRWERGVLVCPREEAPGVARCTDVATTIGLSNSPIHMIDAQPETITIRASGFLTTTGIVLLPEGDVAAPGTLVVCSDSGAANAQALVVNVSGLVRVATDADADGVVELHNGSAVTCP